MRKTASVPRAIEPGTLKQNGANRVQRLRFYSQLFSLLLSIWIGVQFFLFVRYLETGEQSLHVRRPAGVEGWLPISSLLSLRHFLETGIINDLHPAGLIIFVVILLTALLFRKGFCSWVCPVGFVSEMLGNVSERLWRRRIRPPGWLDWPLRMLKYLLLGFFLYVILVQMTSAAVAQFITSDYNRVADIQMLRFFTDISRLSLFVIATLIVLSLVIRGFWCRYLCPYGALLGLLGLLSPTRIRRNPNRCTSCSSCAAACPSFIKVDQTTSVVSDECTGCMACISNCPVGDTLKLHVMPRRRAVSAGRWAVGLLAFFWLSLSVFKITGPWQTSISEGEYMRHIPAVNRGEYRHP